MYPNVAKPFDYKNYSEPEYHQTHEFKTIAIEHPGNWRYVWISELERSTKSPTDWDYWKIPQSLHTADGMKIAAGWIRWQAGYTQQITVKKGQRYVARVTFRAEITQTQDADAVVWWFEVGCKLPAPPDNKSRVSSYNSTAQFGSESEHLFVFEAVNDGRIDLTFWGRSEWPGNECNLVIHTIELLEVPGDYAGSEFVLVQPHPTTTPTPEPEPEPSLAGVGAVLPWVLAGGLLIGIVFFFLYTQQNKGLVAMDLPITSFPDALSILGTALAAIVGGGLLTAPITLLLTAILKRFVNINAEWLNFTVAALLTIAYWLAQLAGVETQFKSALELIQTIAPAILSLITAVWGASAVYKVAAAQNVPVIGFRRAQTQTARHIMSG